MRKIERRTFIKHAAAAATVAGSGALGATFARAQGAAWPNRPIKFIVPLAPGGAIDFIARQVGEVLSRTIGQQVVVENRTGAGGTIGMDLAMKSPADGYTVLITNDNAASAPHIMSLSYDYTKELQAGVLSRTPVADHGRSQGSRRQFGQGAGRLREEEPGTWFCDVGRRLEPARRRRMVCQGGGHQARSRALSRRRPGDQRSDRSACEARVPRADRADAALQDRHLKLLSQSASKRAPTLQEVPTVEESGYKGLVLDAWYAAFVPKGTPPAIVARLNKEMNEALKDPKLLTNFTTGAVEPIGGTPEEIGKLAQADSVKYARLVKELNIKTN